jgi:predicted HAD superfamily phosphohydrolase YqeG
MIGDRVSTDILFGNCHGMKTILVHPITSHGDNLLANIARRFENHLLLPTLRRFGYRGKDLEIQ